MIKLIATDIDGTISYHGKVDPEVVKALKKAQASGIKLTLATGRNARSIQKILTEAGLDCCNIPIIGQNGAEVFTLLSDGTKREEYNHFFDKSETDFLFHQAHKNHVQIFSYAYDDSIAYVSKRYSAFTMALSHSSKRRPIKYDFHHDLKTPISKLIVSGSRKNMAKFVEAVAKAGYPIFSFSYVTNARQNVEVVPKGVNKSEGLKFLAKKFDLKPEEIAYFGDGENDMAAIKWAGWGVAMGNAHDHVQAIADDVAPPVHENGIATMINKLLDNKKIPPMSTKKGGH